MATFNVKVGADPRGVSLSKIAYGTVVMGTLLIKGTASDSVSVTGTASDRPYAVALYDERYAVENAAEQYGSGDIARVETLVPGMVLNLKASAIVAEGDSLMPDTAGGVIKQTGTFSVVGYALEAIGTGNRGKVLITNCGPQ